LLSKSSGTSGSSPSHLFRQDTGSHYFFNVAAEYGCTTRQNWRVSDLDFDDDGVTVTGQNGEVLRAKYLIDASGYRSLPAEKLRPAGEAGPLRAPLALAVHTLHRNQAVRRRLPPPGEPPPADTVAQRHAAPPDRARLVLDHPVRQHQGVEEPAVQRRPHFRRAHLPKPADMTPDEEFNHYLDMYPAVKRQFAGAKRVREWASTDRLQYSSKHSVGYRWCLMSHAAGFIDPLYSRGLSNTFEVVHALCSRLLEALADDDFAMERFEYVDRLERGLLQYNDDVVNSSFVSFSHFRLWNAVFRVCHAFLTPGVMRQTERG